MRVVPLPSLLEDFARGADDTPPRQARYCAIPMSPLLGLHQVYNLAGRSQQYQYHHRPGARMARNLVTDRSISAIVGVESPLIR